MLGGCLVQLVGALAWWVDLLGGCLVQLVLHGAKVVALAVVGAW